MIPTCLRAVLLTILLALAANAQAQQFYVIVGAFAKESNAQKFTGYVRSLRYAAEYELNVEKKYFYVYVLKSQSKEDALAQVKQLQQDSEFKDTWLFTAFYRAPRHITTSGTKGGCGNSAPSCRQNAVSGN
jgi:hypothetical protein